MTPRPGDIVVTRVTAAAPHYLIADGVPLALRRTAAGDAWQARASGVGGAGKAPDGPVPGQPVLLGMPSIGVPA